MCGGRVPTAPVYDFYARTFMLRDFYAPALLGTRGKKKIFNFFQKKVFKKKVFFPKNIFSTKKRFSSRKNFFPFK